MRKKLWHGLLLGFVCAALALALCYTGWLSGWEATTWTWRVRFFAQPGAAAEQIRVILLDQASLDWGKNEHGLSWPWPRQVYSPLIQFCQRAGAKVVAFDVLYSEPSAYGPDDDALFGQSIAESGAFIGAVFLSNRTGEMEQWPPFLTWRPSAITVSEACRAWRDKLEVRRASFPIADVASNAVWLGNVSDEPEEDGVFRRAALFRWFDGTPLPSLGIAAFLGAEKAAGRDVAIQWDPGWLRIGPYRVPVDSQLRALLRYGGGGTGPYKTYNVAGVIQSEVRLQAGEQPSVDPADFKDKYVFFGFSAPGLLDLRVTPLSKVYPGVLIHATQLDNLLSQWYLRDAPTGWCRAGVVMLSILTAVVGRLSRRWWHSVVTILIILPLPLGIGFGAYALGFWWPVMDAAVAVALALVGSVVWNYATEGRQKAFIKQAFKHYISPAYIDQLLEDPNQLKLGGEKKELSIFFSDLQGFSSFSERLDAETLTAFLNEYLTDMTDIIQEEGGTLDKYEGDAIIAFWNAPLTLPDHATRACRAALRCQRKLKDRNREFAQRFGHELKMRIGINTGTVVVGNMGSRERFNYTILGDAANLASRLEGANKAFGTFLMVAESTWQQAQDALVGRCLGSIRVVGRNTPVKVYELLCLSGERMPVFLDAYLRGLEYVARKQWADALREFERIPEDPVSKKYAERCRLLCNQPSEDWDGVWNLTEK